MPDRHALAHGRLLHCFHQLSKGYGLNDSDFYQFSTLSVLALLLAFYGGTYLLTLLIKNKKENTDASWSPTITSASVWARPA